VPRDRVKVADVELIAFELGPAAHLITRDSTGHEAVSPDCGEQVLSRDSLRLRCDVPSIGIVTIVGTFLATRLRNAIVVKTVPGQTLEAVDVFDTFVAVTRGAQL